MFLEDPEAFINDMNKKLAETKQQIKEMREIQVDRAAIAEL